ncbi:chondroitinase family polysaccharide lyase [Arcicella rosea]|uniref:Chondroitin-sulfate-ABC endolyase/exolyase n=1 Tax=Arcicella rosea TaxID=502909 RepID=A0A841EQI9_9BACT|nr:chondroitinase family polysaccharide lyase [Arcicella rosea]MBB6002540.1 chondroitin-sulfate-ABC endolyase/exolyase [Arcicella rosea]
MKKIKWIFIATLCCISNLLCAQIFSFEDGTIPSNWTTTGGTLSSSTLKYKLGTKSLKWAWTAGSSLTVDNPAGLSTVSSHFRGEQGIHLWIYNTTPSTTGKLVLNFLNSSNQVKCHIDFNLNFKGWRCLMARFVPDMGHDKTTLTKMVIQAPATGSGQFYFDRLEFPLSVSWKRNSDAQYSVVQAPTVHDYMGVRAYGNIPTTSTPTSAEVQGIKTIIQRLEDWYLGTGQYATSSNFISRKNAITSHITWAYNANPDDLNLSIGSDSTVTGSGLFAISNANPTNGTPIKYFNKVTTGSMYPLAMDYRLNNNPLRKTQWLNQIDYLHDQGWADGSALGVFADEMLRSYNYFHSMFIMRKELDPVRLARELNTINWQSFYGYVNKPGMKIGDNADFIRNLGYPKMFFALLQADSVKQVAALKPVVNYLNMALSLQHGFGETLKPDYTGYHHGGAYFSAYYNDMLYASVWYYYLLRGTPFELSQTTYNNLKQALLAYRSLSSYYDVPKSLTGRFPLQTEVVQKLLPAFAMLGLSKNQPDTALIGAFKRLWKPTVNPVKKFVSTGNSVGNLNTLGEIEVCLKAAATTIPEELNPQEATYFPYAGTLVHRSPTFHFSVKGFSKYVWDYEAGTTIGEGLYNRYIGYGQFDYTDLITKRRNNNYSTTIGVWDWSRFPGTTYKYLPLAPLASVSGTDRNFSDQSFLGGVSLNDTTSVISMKLHDKMFDTTFYATKSYFAFGNTVVCLGSGIKNKSQTDRTETTLLQQVVKTGESFKVNGTDVTVSQNNINQPIIRDNLGIRYIVKRGKVDIIKRDTMYAAVINHGFAPKDSSYAYFMLLQGNLSQETVYSNPSSCPISILRQDSIAHIVKHVGDQTVGYAIFNSTANLNDTLINKVNIPSLVMLKKQSDGKCKLVISDPDMHRQSGKDSDAVVNIDHEESGSFGYEITLNGLFQLDGNNPGVTLTQVGNTTKLALTVVDGKAYKINLTTGQSQNSLAKVLDFSGENKQGTVFLNWETIDGHAIESFVIEKSNDLNAFSPKAKIYATQGSVNAVYSIIDENIESETFYRLNAISKDGKILDSKTISINSDQVKSDIIFPNPATDNITVDLKRILKDIDVSIYAIDGRIILNKFISGDIKQFSLDVSELKSGIYFVNIVSGVNVSRLKFIKK